MYRLGVVITLVFMVGCGEGGDEDGAVTRDSVGIVIVENVAPAWEEGEGWRVSPEIVVADFTSNQIRWYDTAGAFLRAVGRKSGGPGGVRGDPRAGVPTTPRRLPGHGGIPPGGTLTQVGTNFVLGVWTDELDVEQPRLYRLLRTTGPSGMP